MKIGYVLLLLLSLLVSCDSPASSRLSGATPLATMTALPSACIATASAPTPTAPPSAAPQRTLLQHQPRSDEPLSIDFPGKFVSARLSNAESNRIGLYEEKELLFGQDYFPLGNDAGYSARLSSGSLDRCMERHVREFPEPGVRDMGDYIYLMYDTDKGSRLYLYYPMLQGQPHFNNGYPVFMKQTLSYTQFQGLSVGESIQKVGHIDPVIPLYIEKFDEGTDAVMELNKKEGLYMASVHLLSDGILKIEYERTKEKDYVIHSLVFRRDFTLDGLDGRTCYRILKEDYSSADSKP